MNYIVKKSKDKIKNTDVTPVIMYNKAHNV